MEAYDSSNTTEAVDSDLGFVSHELEAPFKSMRTFVSTMFAIWWGISRDELLPKHGKMGQVLTCFCNEFYLEL